MRDEAGAAFSGGSQDRPGPGAVLRTAAKLAGELDCPSRARYISHYPSSMTLRAALLETL
jgi:hypothetical protein